MKKLTWIFLIIIIVIVGGWIVTKTSYETEPLTPDKGYPIKTAGTPGIQATENTPEGAPAKIEVTSTKGNVITIVAPTETVITRSDSAGFEPKTVTIKKGQTVTWKNSSASPMWVASAMHPTHTVYPTTGGCLGSTFDACKDMGKDESYSFQFDFVGSWKYHNHSKGGEYGTVIVEE